MAEKKKRKRWQKILGILLAIVIIPGILYGSVKAAEWFDQQLTFTPDTQPEVEGAIFDADYAKEVCDPRPVDLFNPITGEVECARWDQEQVSGEEPLTLDDKPLEMVEEEVVEVEVVELAVKPETDKGAVPGTSTVQEIFRSSEALAYLVLQEPNASRQTVFPDVPHGDRPALVAYEIPFEDGDYCDNTPCGMDVPQYYYRVMTAGQVTIPDLSVNCVATDTQGCLVIVINHFGETAMYRGNTIDHGFTIAGRVWDMSTPDNVTSVGQALLDHYVYRMSQVEDGANCGVITACESVEWHVVVIGNGEVQVHWTGTYHR